MAALGTPELKRSLCLYAEICELAADMRPEQVLTLIQRIELKDLEQSATRGGDRAQR
jgi:hypothetical protein